MLTSCSAPLDVELLQQSQFLSRHGGGFGPSMAERLVGWVLHAAGSQHDRNAKKYVNFPWRSPTGPPYTMRGLWVNVLWEELRWAVSHFGSFGYMRAEERELFRKYLEECWWTEKLVAQGVTVALTGDDRPPAEAVNLEDVPEGVTPLGWVLLQKIQRDGGVGEPSAELANTEWTGDELGVMSRLVESSSQCLKWLGLTQAEYDAIAGEGSGKGKGKGEGKEKGSGKAEGQDKGKGKEKAEGRKAQNEGGGKRMNETLKQKGTEKRMRITGAGSGPGESSGGAHSRALERKGAEIEARIRELERTRVELEARIGELERKRAESEAWIRELEREKEELGASAAEWERKFKGRDHEADQQAQEMLAMKVQIKQLERGSRRK